MNERDGGSPGGAAAPALILKLTLEIHCQICKIVLQF